eukprot:CAMPEP_0117481410 /NCGR_PEP_ID=MMETSP0784-20121206/12886_1 /TAXON_ID=39447 /ORGANISM="" /LENGTH=193 /DNA_ID=CAMNT_0005275867 /DNA_START=1 /DNA_END=579 /DNA_ORIENTATION=+
MAVVTRLNTLALVVAAVAHAALAQQHGHSPLDASDETLAATARSLTADSSSDASSGVSVPVTSVTITPEEAKNAKWDWTGCNVRDLCECKLHGQAATVRGLDIASACQDNGYAIPKLDQMYRLTDAMAKNKRLFQCDTLKLNAFCYSQNGCLTDLNKAYCVAMKGLACDVDCNGASSYRRSFTAASIALILLW